MDNIALIVPAYNEAGSIRNVVEGFLNQRCGERPLVDEIVVVNNNSTDETAEIARTAGATVVFEPQQGYGYACLRGISYLAGRSSGPPGILAIAEGDGSADPADIGKLITPVEKGKADFVLGSRTRLASRGALTVQQRFGNWLACRLIEKIYGVRYTDLASLRAIEWNALMKLKMNDKTYGWSIEMQVKAAKEGLRVKEIDVHTYPRTAGSSKVSGTFLGVLGAGWKIITTILKYR